MKVKLAVQVLSKRTSDALYFLKDDLKLKSFQGVSATTKFCRKFNDMFDFLNVPAFSSNTETLQPIRPDNIEI